MVKFKDFSGLLSDFPVLFKAYFQESPLNSSTFQAFANPVTLYHLSHCIPHDSLLTPSISMHHKHSTIKEMQCTVLKIAVIQIPIFRHWNADQDQSSLISVSYVCYSDLLFWYFLNENNKRKVFKIIYKQKNNLHFQAMIISFEIVVGW